MLIRLLPSRAKAALCTYTFKLLHAAHHAAREKKRDVGCHLVPCSTQRVASQMLQCQAAPEALTKVVGEPAAAGSMSMSSGRINRSGSLASAVAGTPQRSRHSLHTMDSGGRAGGGSGEPSSVQELGAPSRQDLVAGITSVFADPEVFGDASDDVAHLRAILRDRCSHTDDAPSSQLAFLCDRYVQRFSKRMAILQKRGGERRESLLAERHWAARLKAFLNRPFASVWSRAYYCVVSLLVVGSCIALIVQTIPSYNPELFVELQGSWNAAELAFAGLLFGDWVLRLLAVCFEPAGRRNRSAHVITFLRQPATVLDFCASFVPATLALAGDSNSVFQIFTLLRVFRIFFSLRHFDAFEDLEDTIRSSLPSLTGPLIALLVVLIGVSSLVYTMEAGSYNESTFQFMVRRTDCEMTAAYELGLKRCFRTESKFLSVVHTMWYTLITFLTVGYGDLVPLTASGRGLGAASIVVGMLFMAMPIAIVGTNFTFTVDRLRTERHCVARMMEEAAEREACRDDVEKVVEGKTSHLALPSLAFLRFLRLNLRATHIDLDHASGRLTYFVDVYLARVVDCLLNDKNLPLAEKLAARATEQRRPYAASLELIPPGHLARTVPFPTVRHSLNMPVDIAVGASPKAQVPVSADTVAGWATALAARKGTSGMDSPRGRRPGLSMVSSQRVPSAADALARSTRQANEKLPPLPFIANVHTLLSLVGYGGAVDTLTAMGVDPHSFTLLDSSLRECTNLGAASRGGYLIFGRLPPGGITPEKLRDTLHARLSFGTPHRVFERASAVADRGMMPEVQ